ncbi:MAG: hypothetical protein KDI36_16365, partial [Pseudomonadales bacterium]|nr:hypothetical protein [Pseudomonadales bacterium]
HSLPVWDQLDDIWDLWIWSEMLFLCLDDRRRSLPELISGTLVLRSGARADSLNYPHEPSWIDWLQQRIRQFQMDS